MKDGSELYRTVMKLIPNQHDSFVRDATALAIFPGGGNRTVSDKRISEVKWARFTWRVWVAGTRGDPEYTDDEVRSLISRKHILPPLLEIQGVAEHTLNQMRWIVHLLLEKKNVCTIILSTAQYHLPRCVLTFVQTWKNEGDARKLRIFVLPTSNPKESDLNECNEGTSTNIEEELKRIALYQKKGHVATLRDLKNFLALNK